MMSQNASLNSLFGDDPFFSSDRLLWPMRAAPLSSSLQQDFFNQRTKMADSLLKELHDGPHMLNFNQFPLISSTMARYAAASQEVQPAAGSDLLVTLDARGYAPSDITVKLEGRSLAVVAMKQGGAEDSQTVSSASSRASFSSSASAKSGFVQRIDLPAHLDISRLSCELMGDGQLRIHAPSAQQPISGEAEQQEVPGRFRSSLEFPVTDGASSQ
ncbi:Heat shock protein beta-11 [Dissostichus eleginoides]|uniref:Heat shock protein beta-11 n=1 Tax=Dissostichus eleginoides TaxID=100907 RepID=A0AAD9EV29_DISEL|nr:Heat shock protein beta-11 [Dissostichus eleginoides]